MPTRSGHPYLLGESSNLNPDTMETQFTQITTTLANLAAQLEAMQVAHTESHNELRGRLEILEEECDTSPERGRGHHNRHNGPHNNRRDSPDPDDRFLKSIKVDVSTFDGRLDPQTFLDWIQSMDKYFQWYPLAEEKKVRFAAMKLTGQASQFWINMEKMRAARLQRPIDTWTAMKDELKGKYVPPSFYPRLLDRWHRFTQGNKSAKDYVSEFDEFLIHCTVLGEEREEQVLSRFRAGLREDLRNKLLARDITELGKAYALVQDLDATKSNHTNKNYTPFKRMSGSTSNFRNDRAKVVEKDDKAKHPERIDKSKVSSTTKCFRCQCYGHMAATCPSPFKISVINGSPVEESDSETDEFVYNPDDED